MSNKNNKQLVKDCFLMSIQRRNPPLRNLFTTCIAVQPAVLMRPATAGTLRNDRQHESSRKEDCRNNAVAESLFGQLENELICGYVLNTIEEGKSAPLITLKCFITGNAFIKLWGMSHPSRSRCILLLKSVSGKVGASKPLLLFGVEMVQPLLLFVR